jgi:hypothetical protein
MSHTPSRVPSGAPSARARAALRLMFVAAAALAAACRPDSATEVSLGQTIVEMGDAINTLQQDNALLQAQIDSLREVVARQDTLIRRVANAAGMPVP